MPFDFAPSEEKSWRGRAAYETGLAAEISAAKRYSDLGYVLVDQRWRGQGGEIDLIFRGAAEFVFVEVKTSKTHDAAAESLSMRQLSRIAQAAEEYIGTRTDTPLAPFRLDLATVDGQGTVETRENLMLY